MGFEADHHPGGIHLYAESLDDPTDFAPSFHLNYHSKLGWPSMQDHLPKHDSTLLHTSKTPDGYQS